MTQFDVFKCHSMMCRLLEVATKARATGTTAMNATSSRSHAICTFTLHVTTADPLGLASGSSCGTGTATSSKFHLVDLAGSERIKKTKAVGGRLREGISINKSLLALGIQLSILLLLSLSLHINISNRQTNTRSISFKFHLAHLLLHLYCPSLTTTLLRQFIHFEFLLFASLLFVGNVVQALNEQTDKNDRG